MLGDPPACLPAFLALLPFGLFGTGPSQAGSAGPDAARRSRHLWLQEPNSAWLKIKRSKGAVQPEAGRSPLPGPRSAPLPRRLRKHRQAVILRLIFFSSALGNVIFSGRSRVPDRSSKYLPRVMNGREPSTLRAALSFPPWLSRRAAAVEGAHRVPAAPGGGWGQTK